MRFVAHLFSVLFHPILVPTYVFLFLYYADPLFLEDQVNAIRSQPNVNPLIAEYFMLTVLIILVFVSFLFPLFTLFLMVKLGFTKSYTMNDRKDRIMPLIAVCFFFFLNYYMVKRYFYLGEIASTIYFGLWLAAAVAFFFTVFYKVSLHAVGAGALLGIMFLTIPFSYFDLLYPFLIVIALAGLIGWARLRLDAHEPMEIYAGYAIGMFALFMAFRFY